MASIQSQRKMSGKHSVSCNNAPFKAHIVRQILQLRLLNIVWLCLLLVACSKERLDAPMCRYQGEAPHLASGAAACLVRIGSKLLAIETEHKAWHLPAGQAQQPLSRQCTAHLAVWQLTGFNVEIGELLGQLEDETPVFACDLQAGFDDSTDTLPVPAWAEYKVRQIALIDPFALTPREWQSPDELIVIRSYFNAVKAPKISEGPAHDVPRPEPEPTAE
ncbi:MAG: hypothetical protein GW763_04555 [Paraglaciecola sp.]|nr:hypothetical protein [Paraglaciecola sp.]NCT47257.1 hypothetical protein [Paraglaciecola sp.]